MKRQRLNTQNSDYFQVAQYSVNEDGTISICSWWMNQTTHKSRFETEAEAINEMHDAIKTSKNYVEKNGGKVSDYCLQRIKSSTVSYLKTLNDGTVI